MSKTTTIRVQRSRREHNHHRIVLRVLNNKQSIKTTNNRFIDLTSASSVNNTSTQLIIDSTVDHSIPISLQIENCCHNNNNNVSILLSIRNDERFAWFIDFELISTWIDQPHEEEWIWMRIEGEKNDCIEKCKWNKEITIVRIKSMENRCHSFLYNLSINKYMKKYEEKERKMISRQNRSAHGIHGPHTAQHHIDVLIWPCLNQLSFIDIYCSIRRFASIRLC